MRFVMGEFKSSAKRGLAVALGLAWTCLVGVSPSEAQGGPSRERAERVEDRTPDPAPATRLLTVKEGRAIVNAAWDMELPRRGLRDCSHLIHEVYRSAGYEYAYQSSYDLYDGAENFARVRYPHAGDLIVWPGHVGIVVNPLEHSFYSLLRTGLEEQDYESAYWKSRGTPRFYRYRIQKGNVVNTAVATPGTAHHLNAKRILRAGLEAEQHASAGEARANQAPKADSERKPLIYGPQLPPELANAAGERAAAPGPISPARLAGDPGALSASIVIATGTKPPTREEVARGISELTDAEGSILRSDEPLKAAMPVVIVGRFSVERLEIKRDHGWAYLGIYSEGVIGGGTIQWKRRLEKVRWELRRTQTGWEAVKPQDRAYVPHDAAVKNLAARLAQLAESDGAAAHEESVVRQEADLVKALGTLVPSQ